MHSALLGLTAYRQFIVYRIVPSVSRPGKTDKFPCDYRTGVVKVSAHDPQYWTDAATAEVTAAAWGTEYGVGFVFTSQDPFWFLDIDGCLIDGAWSPLALSLCQSFGGCAIEVSQSGTGLHIFGTGTPPAHACTNKAIGLEFYHEGRFAALTGAGAVGNCLTDASAVLPALVATYFPPDAATNDIGWTDGPCEEWYGPADDGELFRRAMLSKSVAVKFGGTEATFADLWLVNEAALTLNYPDPNGRSYDASAADAALAQHLAFWTGRDCERIERLMRQSGLMREKWDSHKSYLRELTIIGAVSRNVDVLEDDRPAVAAPIAEGVVTHTVTKREGDGYCTVDQQPDHFAGCVYIASQHRALLPDGTIAKPEVFKVKRGGKVFVMDSQGTKTTKDAWEAWTQNQALAPPVVDGLNFKPNLPPRAITRRNNQTFINSYVPVDIDRKQGDPSPFLTHLAKVLPDERDRTIMLSYMAACVQHQGVKFQWAPLLQGVEGNGKTLFARCIEKAVGTRYTHWVTASKLSSTFNSWLEGKVFYAVEDIYVPDSKREIFEDLKPMVTNDTIEIEAKGVDKVSVEVCGNFMFNSNHRDAIRKTENDRRICILFSAQQQRSDLERDGMGGDYFPNLYKWLREDGYAVVSEYLHTYAIANALNPAVDCQRAPITTSTAEAIGASAGNVEQEIEEAIAQGQSGFSGGWVSSTWLERLLEAKGLARKISHHKRKQILEQMGYIYHPALKEGRVNNNVLPDNTKPRLFIHSTALAAQITNPLAAAKDYESANTKAMQMPFAQSYQAR